MNTNVNIFEDSTFRILLNLGYKFITVFPHPDIQLHFMFDDLRVEDNEVIIQAFPLTEFFKNNRGHNNADNIVALISSWIEKNKIVVVRLYRIPYITHASI